MKLKEKIIHESLKLFSLKGFLGTSIHDILEAADTSKGGFYNHFSSKEDLFFQVIDEARKIWRERNLKGLDKIDNPTEIIKRLLKNYKDRYLKDADNFPGGCVFITLAAELNHQRPQLSKELEKGFIGLKGMLKRLLEQGKESGELIKAVNTDTVTEILFSGMLGASISFGVNKSKKSLDKSINSLIEYLEELKI
ncbi:MAG: TetR/AcrR family transcriptional regulator [Desulfobacterales bacterium]|nr:TetR/AcrR family transcriptional regulator [Desulfobacterales bacterium]